MADSKKIITKEVLNVKVFPVIRDVLEDSYTCYNCGKKLPSEIVDEYDTIREMGLCHDCAEEVA